MLIYMRPEYGGYILAGYPSVGSQMLGGYDLPDYRISNHTRLSGLSLWGRTYLQAGKILTTNLIVEKNEMNKNIEDL